MTNYNLMPQIALATYDDDAQTVRLVFYQKASGDPMAAITHQVVVYLPDAVQYTMETAPSDPAAQPVGEPTQLPADETLEG